MSRRGLSGGGATEELYDFRGENLVINDHSPFILTASNADINKMPVTTGVARAYFRIRRPGIVTGIAISAEDGMTANGSDYLTFTALNLQTAADGNRSLLSTTAHVNTTDTNAVSLNSGTSLTAKVIYDLALS